MVEWNAGAGTLGVPWRELRFGPLDSWPDLPEFVFLNAVLRELDRNARHPLDVAEELASCWHFVENHGFAARIAITSEPGLIFLPSLMIWAEARGIRVTVERLRTSEERPAIDSEGPPSGEDLGPCHAATPGEELPDTVTEHAEDMRLAELFDPVGWPQLEKMFPTVPPGSGQKSLWKDYCNRADRHGLVPARCGRARFNPYLAAKWWLARKCPPDWIPSRCLRVLANNLPARSRHARDELLFGATDWPDFGQD